MSLNCAMRAVNKKLAIRRYKLGQKWLNRWSLSIKNTFAFFAATVFSSFTLQAATSTNQWGWDHFGLLYDRVSLTFTEGESREILGPIFGYQTSGTASLFRLSPLFSLYKDSAIPQTEAELGYPILTFDKFGKEYRLQLFQIFAFAGGEKLEGGDKDRITLFPIYFQQRGPEPEDNYTAVVPIYGELRNRLFRDRVYFILLPLYLQTEKRGVITDNYLFPFFHRRHGGGVEGWQFWPLIGKESKGITVSTNHWGDEVMSPGHEKFSALWPIHFNNTLGIGTTNVQEQFLVLPFYASQESPSRVSKSYGWPLGYTHTVDRERGYEEHDLPWPFIVFANGPGKTTRRIWPLFSQAKTPILQSDFYAWPIFKYDRITSAPLDRERTRILLFLYSDLIERNTTNNTALRRRDFWPLFTWRKDHRENERLQILSILEPIIPNNKSIERVYSPVWSIYRQEKNGVTGDSSRSFLWNLYRSEKRGDARRTSALFGLFQREKTPEETRWRLFFIPFSTTDQSPER